MPLYSGTGTNAGTQYGKQQRAHNMAKISNKSSFGIIDIAESSTSDRIIVIVEMACLIDDGAYRVHHRHT